MSSLSKYALLLLLVTTTITNAFSPPSSIQKVDNNLQQQQQQRSSSFVIASSSTTTTRLYQQRKKKKNAATADNRKINTKRRQQLGIADDEDEYDLEMALDNSTDPFITKVVAGSFIVVMIALLVVGVVVPSITDYSSEGLCSPIQNGGRC